MQTYRYFVPIYIVLAILTAVICGLTLLDSEYVPALLRFASVAGILIFVLAFIFILLSPYLFISMQFYRTTATRQAYLTFTIPADTKTILLSKLIVNYIWTILTTLLWLTALFLFITFETHQPFSDILSQLFYTDNIGVSILQVSTFLIGSATTVLSIFAAISLSQLVRDHRIIASIAFYVAIYTVQQILSLIIMTPFALSLLREGNSGFEVNHTALYGYSYSYSSSAVDNIIPLVLALALSLVVSIVCFLLSNFMLKRKLNLL